MMPVEVFCSMWQWLSTPPGSTQWSRASISTLPGGRCAARAVTIPSLTPMSAKNSSTAVATLPLRMTRSNSCITTQIYRWPTRQPLATSGGLPRRRERGGNQNPVFRTDDHRRTVLDVSDPIRLGRELLAAGFPVGMTLVAPHMDDLVLHADVGGVEAEEIAEDPLHDGQSGGHVMFH